MKAAVIEFHYYHDELLPSIVYVLNQLGAKPDVFVPSRAARKNAFAHVTDLQYSLKLIDSPSLLRDLLARIRGTPSRYRRYEVLLMNSIEPLDTLAAASRIELPTVATIHNAELLKPDTPYGRFFAGPTRQPLLLGRHIAASVGTTYGAGWLLPVYYGNVTPARGDRDGRQRLSVSGNVQFTRRDYASLVDAIAQLAVERSDFVVQIVGRSDSRDGRTLRADVDARGLSRYFAFTGGEISHGRYLSLLAGSDFILPLINTGNPVVAAYFELKMASSMSMAIGLGVIPVANATLAQVYQVDGAAVTYQADRLLEGIRAALDLAPADRAGRVLRLSSVRSEALSASVRNIAALLDRLGVAHA
jgi:hypothetical protein